MAASVIYELYSRFASDSGAGALTLPASLMADFGTPNAQLKRDASSTPTVTKATAGQQSIATSAALNLSTLPNLAGVASDVSLVGLKMAAMCFQAPATNTQVVTLKPDVSTGFDFMAGDPSVVISLSPGDLLLYIPGAGTGSVRDAVASPNDLNIALSTTGTQLLNWGIAAGA